jgi:hypothetical protein
MDPVYHTLTLGLTTQFRMNGPILATEIHVEGDRCLLSAYGKLYEHTVRLWCKD